VPKLFNPKPRFVNGDISPSPNLKIIANCLKKDKKYRKMKIFFKKQLIIEKVELTLHFTCEILKHGDSKKDCRCRTDTQPENG
jgi:hypothetical protein